MEEFPDILHQWDLWKPTLSERFKTSFVSNLPGDRIVHDYIRTGGYIDPSAKDFGHPVPLPRFSDAIWDDIVSIRSSNRGRGEAPPGMLGHQ